VNLTQFIRSDKSKDPHFLLFGNPVGHSLSPLMHNKAADIFDIDIQYYGIELRPDELSSFSAHLNRATFRGANVTIPYKHVLMQYMDDISLVARSIGAINTIVKKEHRILGDNTDVYGFSVPLKAYAEELSGSNAIIFGTGGATRAIVNALSDFGIEKIRVISREPSSRDIFEDYRRVEIKGYDAWTSFAENVSIIVNATPLGMEPYEDSSPVQETEKDVLKGKICYDIVYNPLETKFLKLAGEAGARTIGGLDMLIHQGSKSFELWTGYPFPIDEIKKSLHESFL